MNQKTGIYYITHRSTGKGYVGQAVDIDNRLRRHKNPARKNHCAIGLAILKYGIVAFDFSVIELCTQEHLNAREVYWITKMQTMSPRGYNLRSGGGAATSVSDATRQKMIDAWKTRPSASAETRAKISSAGLGRSHSMASRAKIGQANKGRASTVKGIERSATTKAKISAARMGHTHSEGTRKKLSAAQKGRPAYNRMAILRSDGIIFQSMQDAANNSGVCRAAVGKQIKGEIKMAKGFTFTVIKPAATTGSLGSSGGSATVSSVSDA